MKVTLRHLSVVLICNRLLDNMLYGQQLFWHSVCSRLCVPYERAQSRFSDVAGLCGALHPDRSENMEWRLSAAHPVHDRMELACIAHKSSEICERCRLRQQNPAAASLWRGLFQLCGRAVARRAKVGLRLRRTIPLLFGKKNLKTG
jgi:hypothetical protein